MFYVYVIYKIGQNEDYDMRKNYCVACGEKEDLQHHHLIPRSKGGSDKECNLITLCTRCHGFWHGADWSHNHASLVADGISKARRNGVRLGPKPKPIDKASVYLKKGSQPIDDVIFCLFHIELIPITVICTMTWGEMTSYKETYSDTTEQMIDRAVSEHTYRRKNFSWLITLNMHGVERSPNAIAHKLGRIRRGDKQGCAFPYQLPEIDLEKARECKAKNVLREKNKAKLRKNKEKIVSGEGIPEKLHRLVDLI